MDITNEYGLQRTPEQIKADPNYAKLDETGRALIDNLCNAYEAEQAAVGDQKAADVAVAALTRQCQEQRNRMRPVARTFLDEWKASKEVASNPNYKSPPPDPAIAAMQDELDELEKRLAMARDLNRSAHNAIKEARAVTARAITAWQRQGKITPDELLHDNARRQFENRLAVKEGRAPGPPQGQQTFMSTVDAQAHYSKGGSIEGGKHSAFRRLPSQR